MLRGAARFAVAVVSLCALAAAFSSPLPWDLPLVFARQAHFRNVPVVMVVFDELPLASLLNENAHVDAHDYPNFARLERDSIWFRNMTSVATFTKEAVPSILTGIEVPPHLPDGYTFQDDLFTLLGGAYPIRSVQALPGMCPTTACNDASLTSAPSATDRFGAFVNSNRGRRFTSFLRLLRPTARPNFYFLHLLMPHSPWRYLPSGQRYPEPEPVPGEENLIGRGKKWGPNAWLVAQAYERHLLQLRLTDRILGAIVRRLKTAHLYGSALLLVLPDHGVAFQRKLPKRVPRPATVGAVGAIPFFLKLPFQRRGRVSDAPVDTLDVLPTVADALSLSHVWPYLEGRSALQPIPVDRTRTVYNVPIGSRGREKYAVVARKYATFGSSRGSIDPYELGPGNSERLIGRRISAVPLQAPSRAVVRVEDAEAYVHPDSGAGVFPALLSGTLQGLTPAGSRPTVAIAVDGRVAAVTRVYLDHGVSRFYSILDPGLFRPRRNRLRFFVVRTGPSGRRLQPVARDKP